MSISSFARRKYHLLKSHTFCKSSNIRFGTTIQQHLQKWPDNSYVNQDGSKTIDLGCSRLPGEVILLVQTAHPPKSTFNGFIAFLLFELEIREITPADENEAAAGTGKVTLYFAQEDFDAFNLINPAATLPDNLLIKKRSGTSTGDTGLPSTYPGSPENLSDVETVWNSSAQRWRLVLKCPVSAASLSKLPMPRCR